MASEYLKRNPTSTGNNRVFTWAGWVKINKLSTTANTIWYAASSGNSEFNISFADNSYINVFDYNSSYLYQYQTTARYRDYSNWFHLVVAVDTTKNREDDRFKIYVNGVLYNGTYVTEIVNGGINYQTRMNTPGEINYLGINVTGGANYHANSQLTDVFMVDGQALTPDVFGFYKEGKGYISAGSTQATDFRPGQWVPKTPRVIKTEINRRGGFGVNGFYLPMNDSNNFGADFHCDPNSIIKLNEELPQPRVGVATTASVGLGYTDALRADPYAANLVLSLPFVSSGLCTNGTNVGVNTGFGDYSAVIKGSGTSVSLTNAGVSIASTAGYYGSAAFFNNANASGTIKLTGDNAAVNFGSGDWTVESWIFPTQIYNYLNVIGTRPDNGGYADAWHIGIDTAGTIGVYSNAYDVQTPAIIKANQWTHIAAVRKSNNLTFYVNGVAAGINTNYTKTPTRTLFGIGQFPSSNTEAFPGYIQDLRIYKGVAKYTGGFDVPKPYTPVGISTWRAVPDCTANNFATWNPISPASDVTYTNGNLTVAYGSNTTRGVVTGTIGIAVTGAGKYYWENRIDASSLSPTAAMPGLWGMSTSVNGLQIYSGSTNTYGWSYYGGNGNLYYATGGANTSVSYGATFTTGDIIGVSLDMTASNGTLTFYKNGVSQGVATTGIGTFLTNGNIHAIMPSLSDGAGVDTYTASSNFGQNPTFSGNVSIGTFTDSNGKGLFKYQPPSGFLALCEDNLPTPAISNPGQHFKTVLWTGSASSRNIVGVGFTPDLVWVMPRNNSGGYFNAVFDSVRGSNRVLSTNSNNAENSAGNWTQQLMSFDYDGFSLGNNSDGGNYVNLNAYNYVTWCWRAGAGTTSTNTNGSITSVVSVNQDAGFSIVSYTGNGGTASIGHGLGKQPSFIIVKNRSEAAVWPVYHKSLGNAQAVELQSTTAAYSAANTWNSTTPSSTTFSVKTIGSNDVNKSNSNYIAYCWAEIEGFSKFGSYVGNGNADGPFVWTGFSPAFVLIKNASSAYNWYIIDNARSSTNPVSQTLSPNLSTIEDTGWTTNSFCDFTSNGFKVRGSNLSINESGSTIIFAAFAQSPFSYSNAK